MTSNGAKAVASSWMLRSVRPKAMNEVFSGSREAWQERSRTATVILILGYAERGVRIADPSSPAPRRRIDRVDFVIAVSLAQLGRY